MKVRLQICSLVFVPAVLVPTVLAIVWLSGAANQSSDAARAATDTAKQAILGAQDAVVGAHRAIMAANVTKKVALDAADTAQNAIINDMLPRLQRSRTLR
eukprot:NODE_17272_length_375_cov_51.801587_g16955_i0.p1 GENE.NODE_17272_length_375_cov_51.801587_g16955_i0~~NODE_17272_length_375_cov_51.801587_g16955_i0.p1  ORF type:complete len:100 (-),score=18.39 NODE_17272_length_375_cov_51.801587_g16955_i0:7-306(-)